MRAVLVSLLLAGCSSDSSEPWLLEWNDCVLTNNITRAGTPTSWQHCRVYWNGDTEPQNGDPFARIALISTSSGSFDTPGDDWLVVSVSATDLRYDDHTGRIATCGTMITPTKNEIGDRTIEFAGTASGYCGFSGRPGEPVSGSFSVSGSAASSAGGLDTDTGPLH